MLCSLVNELHDKVLKRIYALQNDGAGKMLDEYNQNLFRKNKTVRLKKGNIVFETMIKNVSATGTLVTEDVIERNFNFDEVKWLDM